MNPLAAVVRLVATWLLTLVLVPPALALALLERAGAHRLGKRALAVLQSYWSRWVLWLLGFRLEVVSPPHIGPAVIGANHLSHIDVLVLSAVFPSRFVAKSEIRGWPVMGSLVALAGTLFIKRGDRSDVPRVVGEIRETLAAGVSVSFFPEGWASRGLRVKRFHAGLFQAAADGGFPCLPVALSYATPEHTAAPAWTVAWWGPVPIGRHVWRMMRQGPVTARVDFPREALHHNDRKALAEAMQAAVAERFVPLRQTPVPPPIEGDPLPDEDRDRVDP